MTINYRESYDIFATSGILFNHESPLRGREFVTRKISDSVAKIKLGQLNTLELGNLDAQRDWGFAQDYVLGMYQMLQVETADTFVLATNRKQSIRDFVNMSFSAADIPLEWSGSGENECAVNASNGRTVVSVNPRYYRPAEVDLLIGDASKAKSILGWTPKTTLEDLCQMMVAADIRRNELGRSY
jgi:GDPmannose 4,6-dehydratase